MEKLSLFMVVLAVLVALIGFSTMAFWSVKDMFESMKKDK